MRNNASHGPDNTFVWRELLENAQKIDKWTEEERKSYLFTLLRREFKEGRRWYREIVKVLILNREARQNFIQLLEIKKEI